jgi:hypothetical protein
LIEHQTHLGYKKNSDQDSPTQNQCIEHDLNFHKIHYLNFELTISHIMLLSLEQILILALKYLTLSLENMLINDDMYN